MNWAAMSPTPHRNPELITWVFTGWIAKQFWYHFQTLSIFFFCFVFFFKTEREGEKKKGVMRQRERENEGR